MNYVLLFFVTILQNASFTLVSRARNSKSIFFHAVASVLSNGIWFIVVRQVTQDEKNVNVYLLGIVYTTAAVIGSITMHWFSMNVLEKLKWFK